MNDNHNPNAVDPAEVAEDSSSVDESDVRRIIIAAQHIQAGPGYARTPGDALSR